MTCRDKNKQDGRLALFIFTATDRKIMRHSQVANQSVGSVQDFHANRLAHQNASNYFQIRNTVRETVHLIRQFVNSLIVQRTNSFIRAIRRLCKSKESAERD